MTLPPSCSVWSLTPLATAAKKPIEVLGDRYPILYVNPGLTFGCGNVAGSPDSGLWNGTLTAAAGLAVAVLSPPEPLSPLPQPAAVAASRPATTTAAPRVGMVLSMSLSSVVPTPARGRRR